MLLLVSVSELELVLVEFDSSVLLLLPLSEEAIWLLVSEMKKIPQYIVIIEEARE